MDPNQRGKLLAKSGRGNGESQKHSLSGSYLLAYPLQVRIGHSNKKTVITSSFVKRTGLCVETSGKVLPLLLHLFNRLVLLLLIEKFQVDVRTIINGSHSTSFFLLSLLFCACLAGS